jgi:hypothetical protein
MKILFISFSFAILLNSSLVAKNSYYIIGGPNYSSFRTTASEYVTGHTFGIGTEWHSFYKFSIALEALYTLRGGILRDKIVGGRDVRYVYLQDIHCSFRSIEIPLLLKYAIPIRKNVRLKIICGPAISIGYKDKSEKIRKDFLFEVIDPDDWDNIQYDYDFNMDPGGPLPYIALSSGIALNTGLALKWSRLKLECRYAYDLFDIDTIRAVYLHEKIHSMQVLFGIIF